MKAVKCKPCTWFNAKTLAAAAVLWNFSFLARKSERICSWHLKGASCRRGLPMETKRQRKPKAPGEERVGCGKLVLDHFHKRNHSRYLKNLPQVNPDNQKHGPAEEQRRVNN